MGVTVIKKKIMKKGVTPVGRIEDRHIVQTDSHKRDFGEKQQKKEKVMGDRKGGPTYLTNRGAGPNSYE